MTKTQAKYAFYFKSGNVERAAGGGRVRYTWRQGYNELMEGGETCFPALTRYEAMDQAISEGRRAKFFETIEQARAAIARATA